MTDHYLSYVPKIMDWQPTKEAADRAADYVRSFAQMYLGTEARVHVRFFEGLSFCYGMENWDGAKCPNCDTEVDTHDWFVPRLNALPWPTAAADLLTLMPCCGTVVSLSDLKYGWPTAFARFSLSAENPAIEDTTKEQDAEVERLIGTPLLKIWVRV